MILHIEMLLVLRWNRLWFHANSCSANDEIKINFSGSTFNNWQQIFPIYKDEAQRWMVQERSITCPFLYFLLDVGFKWNCISVMLQKEQKIVAILTNNERYQYYVQGWKKWMKLWVSVILSDKSIFKLKHDMIIDKWNKKSYYAI